MTAILLLRLNGSGQESRYDKDFRVGRSLACSGDGRSKPDVLLPSYNTIGYIGSVALQHTRSGDEDKEGVAPPLDEVLWRSVRSMETIRSPLA